MKIYPSYIKFCEQVARNDKVFGQFRKNHVYHSVVEGVPEEQGAAYLDYIIKHYPYLLEHLDDFMTNDNIGMPPKYYYKSIGKYISSATCRYIKILGDLLHYFDDLEKMDIVEIGGGYGGQCKIIHNYLKPRSYTIIDLPAPCMVTQKYLRSFGIKGIEFKHPTSVFDKNYSLCISNYGFSEFERKFQDLYAEKVITKSERGYIICNFFGESALKGREGCFSKEEIRNLKSTGKIYPEEPLSTAGNFLYVWVATEAI